MIEEKSIAGDLPTAFLDLPHAGTTEYIPARGSEVERISVIRGYELVASRQAFTGGFLARLIARWVGAFLVRAVVKDQEEENAACNE